ncbi:MAG: hypothetical protein Q4Q03_04410 [Bowdeniella nasicola]|nr:hypothetical protein [Bowdeniella nasicola]
MPASATISIIGAVFFLAGFGALNIGWVTSKSYSYQIANFLGAACFTYTAIKPFNPGLFITEAIWALLGVYGIWVIVKTSRAREADRRASA